MVAKEIGLKNILINKKILNYFKIIMENKGIDWKNISSKYKYF